MPRLFAALAFSLLVLTARLSAQQPPQQDFSKVQVETQKVAGNIYMLVGAGGNIAVSTGDDGLLMVDTEYPPLFDKIEAALKKLSDKPLRFVIDTHWHLDHASGNENFARAGAIIVAQENVRRILASGTMRDGVKYPPFPKDDLPTVTYNDHTTIYFNGEPVKADPLSERAHRRRHGGLFCELARDRHRRQLSHRWFSAGRPGQRRQRERHHRRARQHHGDVSAGYEGYSRPRPHAHDRRGH